MLSIDSWILITGILLLLGIASNKFSARMGVPVLFLFLVVGMLAGSEGLGGIEFEDYSLANAIGTVALCLILFDGGLRTPYHSVRAVWKPAAVLATVGVVVTAVITGLAASWILRITILEGLLLGSIVGSTDAAVVFSVLRSGGVNIKRRLADTLEVESGSNDPMAIFLTVGLIQVLTNAVPLGAGLLALFLTQLVLGTVVGLLDEEGLVTGATVTFDRIALRVREIAADGSIQFVGMTIMPAEESAPPACQNPDETETRYSDAPPASSCEEHAVGNRPARDSKGEK